MKRSIAGTSVAGFIVVLGAAAAAPGCADETGTPDQAGLLGSETAALAGAGADEKERRGAEANDLSQIHCPDDVPAALDPPADATLAVALPARGVQIYTCVAATPGVAPAWTLKAPHAVLGRHLDVKAIHFAGPSWEATDGSLVTGTKTASSPAPDATSVPWLLLKAATHSGTGVLADITWIQRLATEGGAAPTTGCDAAHLTTEVLAPYSADYFFYRTASDSHIRQCASR